MARRPRFDSPGSLHHVWGRGIARRTMFERRSDIRYLKAALVRQVRKGRIQILAFSFLTTHYHLVVRSLCGELSKAMGQALDAYVRRFNRTRGREGTLPSSRFHSRVVNSETYFKTLVRYVDQNAPEARLSDSPEGYPFGSALLYASVRRPRWLHAEDIDARMGNPAPADRAQCYRKCFGAPLTEAQARLVEFRASRTSVEVDALDSLIGAAPSAVREWMRRKAHLADNTRPGQAFADAKVILDAVRAVQKQRGAFLIASPKRRTIDAWSHIRIGVLRDLGGLMQSEISTCLRETPSTVRRYLHRHRDLTLTHADYATIVAQVARFALDVQWGGPDDSK